MAGYSQGRRNNRGRGGGSFRVADGGREFHSPPPWTVTSSPDILDNFRGDIKCLGGYSEDDDADFSNDKSGLSFFYTKYMPENVITEKKVRLDLNLDRKETRPYTGTTKKKLHNFLSWILSNEEKFHKEINPPTKGGKFVIMKSVLNMITITIFTFNREIEFYATCVNGIIYCLTKDNKDERYPTDEVSIWTQKFQKYLTDENEEEGLVCNRGYRCVLTSKIGDHKLLYSTSIDCVNPEVYDEKMPDLSACVDLKCSKLENIIPIEKRRMLYWCNGLVLTGTPKVVVGFRDDNGIVDTLKLYDVQTLITKGKEYWNMNTSFVFMDKFLSFVKNRTEREPGVVFSFLKETRSLTYTSREHDVEDFIPNWFLNEIHTRD